MTVIETNIDTSAHTSIGITREEYIEGFVGGFGSILSYYLLSKKLKLKNIGTVMSLTFFITWFLRKITLDIYQINAHKLYNKSHNTQDLDMLLIHIVSAIVAVSVLLAYISSTKSISYISVIIYFSLIIGVYWLINKDTTGFK